MSARRLLPSMLPGAGLRLIGFAATIDLLRTSILHRRRRIENSDFVAPPTSVALALASTSPSTITMGELATDGIGLVKPNHYGEMLRTVWANRRNLKYGWNVLTKGACDGCALGVAGLHMGAKRHPPVHARLRLLSSILGVMNAVRCGRCIDRSSRRGGLRELVVGYPMRRRAGRRVFGGELG